MLSVTIVGHFLLPRRELVIVGASGRSAAQSALRSGFEPHVIDLFCDFDLAIYGSCVRINDAEYPEGISRRINQSAPDVPWLYTGGLENYPDLVEDVAGKRRLLGNSAAVLRAVRDPLLVADAFRASQIPFPAVSRDALNLESSKTWLRKRLGSAGGQGISRLSGSNPKSVDDCYFQEEIAGDPASAVYLANGATVQLLGMTLQLIGRQWLHAPPFAYCGSLGPVTLDERTGRALHAIGDCIVNTFRLRGLFGVDFILNDAGVWPVEINPRYTASVEIVERVYGCPLIDWHVSACGEGTLPGPLPETHAGLHGKAILYADRELRVTPEFVQKQSARNVESDLPTAADIPCPDTVIHSGQPVMTVFAEAESLEELSARLRQEVVRLREELEY